MRQSAVISFLFAATLIAAAEGNVSSKVLRLHVPALVQGRYDAEVVLYHRDGEFHNGYVLLPQRDNLVHRLDVTPSPEVQFVDKSGRPFDVPEEALGYYSYKNAKWLKYREQYYGGEISIKHPNPIKPVAWDGKTLGGDLGILINEVDASNAPGRRNDGLVYRLKIDAKQRKTALSGKVVAWQYADKDPRYGAEKQKRTLKVTGEWDAAPWSPQAGSEFAGGSDWPMAQGPELNGSAVACRRDLVSNLRDARLLWVAEEELASGRGGGLMRGDFCMYPIAWTTKGEGGYGGPIIADGKVFLYMASVDLKALRQRPELQRDPYFRLGADPRLLGGGHKHLKPLAAPRDTVYAFDARTGKRLWQFNGEPGSASHYGGKGGKASIPCYYNGKVYVRIGGGVICLDAESGEKVWFKGGYGLHAAPADASVTQVGGALVLMAETDGGWKTVGPNRCRRHGRDRRSGPRVLPAPEETLRP